MIKRLDKSQTHTLLQTLQARFESNAHRHENLSWSLVAEKVQQAPGKLWSLHEMERTGGEPDVIQWNKADRTVVFCDCSTETPAGRRSLCYDAAALQARKQNRPEESAVTIAAQMGLQMLNEDAYRFLQTLQNFDTRTSSWIETPENIRKLGGALFGDFRFGRVFIYHNGAASYYAARGFRGMVTF